MKKLILPFALFSLAFCLSCKKDVPVPPTPVPIAPPAGPSTTPPATPPPVPQAKDENSTSVKIGKDGIDVDAQKTKVTIDKNGTAVEVKK